MRRGEVSQRGVLAQKFFEFLQSNFVFFGIVVLSLLQYSGQLLVLADCLFPRLPKSNETMASRPASSGSTELFKEPQAVVLVTGENSPDALSTPGPPSSIEAHKDGDLPADSPAAAQTRRATTTALSMAALGVVALLSSLDITIVTTALPSIVADFKSKLGYVWIGSAFTLAFTAITPVWGSVADVWGRKPIMLIALVLFLAGSLLCALAPTMDLMIAGRALQGIGASGTGTMTNVIISDLFALRDRGLYLAIMSIVSAVGTAIGARHRRDANYKVDVG